MRPNGGYLLGYPGSTSKMFCRVMALPESGVHQDRAIAGSNGVEQADERAQSGFVLLGPPVPIALDASANRLRRPGSEEEGLVQDEDLAGVVHLGRITFRPRRLGTHRTEDGAPAL